MEKKNILVSIMVFLRQIDHEGFEIWTQKRLEEGPLFGKMEFPGGKIEAGESPLEAVIREVHEEVGFLIPAETAIKLFKMQIYTTETKNICLYVHYAQLNSPHLAEDGWYKLNYVSKSDPLKGIIPEINHVFIDELAVYMKAEIDKGTLRF